MKLFKHLLVILAFLSTSVFASQTSPRILMVVSSHGIDQGETQPGYEFDEFSKAYIAFTENGAQVDIASPKGGKVEADQYDPEKPFNAKILTDTATMEKLNHTLPLSAINADDYQAVFVVGGKGAMFDFPYDTNLQTIIADIYENNGTVSAVCHGPAALVNVKLSDGSYLVADKRVNGFTNQEEKTFGKKWVKHFDFLLEDKLTERGATFESAPMMLEYVAVDGRLITGQNPFSTAATAYSVLESLGITPKQEEKDPESRTIALIARILKGDQQAPADYLASADKYQTPLIGMYGYYSLKHADDDAQIQQAVNLMELAGQNMEHPRLKLSIAQGQKKLGQKDKARATLTALLAKNPEMQEAESLLAELQE